MTDHATLPSILELLEFDRAHPRHDGTKATVIAATFAGMTVGRYYQLLFAAIETTAALEYDALLVRQIHDRLTCARRTRDKLLGFIPRKDHHA